MQRVKIQYSIVQGFINYLEDCVFSTAKTNDLIKEYLIAKTTQQIIYKLQQLNLKYQHRHPTEYKTKSIALTELELICLSFYFERYEVPVWLLPTQYDFLECLRINFPLLAHILGKKQNWQQVIESKLLFKN